MAPESGVELVIAHYLLGIEQLFPGLKASVLWVKDDCIWNLVSPSLHPGYIAAIDGQKIGLNRGSCGTAAYLKERIIVSDVFSDPRWASFRDLAKQYQIASCWSQPIFNKRGEVIATFALYYQEARNPDEREIEAIDRSKSLLAILLTNYLHVQNILENKERYEYLNKATNDAIYDWDLQANQIVWGESFTRLFGYEVENSLLNTSSVWKEIIIPNDFIHYQDAFNDFLNQTEKVKWEANYQVIHVNGANKHIKEIAYLIRNHLGKGIRMIGVLRDITEQVQHNQLNHIQAELAENFKANNLLQNILDDVLCSLCNFGHFHTAEIWLTSLDNTHINLISTYAKDNISRRYFENSKHIKTLNKGEGIPGKVWNNHKPMLLNDIQSNSIFVRTAAVKEAELFASYALPLVHGQETVGVLMFCSRYSILEDQSELNVLKSLGDFLGAEIKRKQQEEEMFLLFESAPEMMAITSPNGYFTKVNPAFCKVLGYSAEEIEYKPFVQFLHPEDVSNTLREFDETKTGERTADNFVNRYLTKSGENKWISWSSSDVFGEDGFVFAFGRDITEMKEMENLLASATQFSKVGGWELSLLKPESDNLSWSSITWQIFELDFHHKLNYQQMLSFFPSVSKDSLEHALNKLSLLGEPFDLKLEINTSKGNKRWIRIIGKSDFYKGVCTRAFGSIQDIHEQRLLELELQQSLVEKTEILESIGDAFYRVDANWMVVYWNKESELLLDMPREQILGKNLWEVYPNAVGSGFYENFYLAVKEKRNVHFEEYHPDSQHWFEVSAYPTYDGLSIYFKDVTQRVIYLEKVRRSNERFEKVTEATNDAIWDWDLETGSLYWGNGFKTQFGYDSNYFEPNLNAWEDLLHPDDRARVVHALNKAIESENQNSVQMEYRYLKADGTYAFVTDRSIIIRNNNGKPIRMIGAMADITPQIEFQRSLMDLNQQLEIHAKELAISNRELEQFAYIASHDLQEPLRMVSSFLTQLEKKYGNSLDEKAHQYIHFAVDGAKRMRQIILDLLDYSRVGKNEGEPELISLNNVIEEVLALHRKTIEEKCAQFNIEQLPNITAFRGPILQVFHNIIGNAIKYAKENETPNVNIRAIKKDTFLEIAIQDNGIGIEQEYFDKIFIIFQRLHNSEKYGGTGMGLAIVKKILENLGGAVRVESTPGKGSTFYLLLPVN
jgi:PAS domain S-box-containing protein